MEASTALATKAVAHGTAATAETGIAQKAVQAALTCSITCELPQAVSYATGYIASAAAAVA
jgi:hypothetical protein